MALHYHFDVWEIWLTWIIFYIKWLKGRNIPLETIYEFYKNITENVIYKYISSVQLLSCVQLFATPWTAALQASLSTTNSRSPPKPMFESVMPSNHFILSCPHLLLPSIFPSIRIFSNESALGIRWPKYWSFSFNISPSNEHPGLISFRVNWLDLPAVQGTLKSLLQHHSSKYISTHMSYFYRTQQNGAFWCSRYVWTFWSNWNNLFEELF